MHPRFAPWHQAFWDYRHHRGSCTTSIAWWRSRTATAARQGWRWASAASETASYAEVLRAFRAGTAKRRPGLRVITGIMALDGSVETLT